MTAEWLSVPYAHIDGGRCYCITDMRLPTHARPHAHTSLLKNWPVWVYQMCAEWPSGQGSQISPNLHAAWGRRPVFTAPYWTLGHKYWALPIIIFRPLLYPIIGYQWLLCSLVLL